MNWCQIKTKAKKQPQNVQTPPQFEDKQQLITLALLTLTWGHYLILKRKGKYFLS